MKKIINFIKANDLMAAFGALLIGTMIGISYINGWTEKPGLFIIGVTATWLGWIAIHAGNEVERVRKGTHTNIFIVRGIIMFLYALLMSVVVLPLEQGFTNLARLHTILSLLAFEIGLFMVFFDVFYNIYKGRNGINILYLGNQAWQDRLYNKIKNKYVGWGLAIIIDIVVLILSAKFLVYTLNLYR